MYWVNLRAGKLFCLIEASLAETANRVHREAYGLVADQLYEVTRGSQRAVTEASTTETKGA